ncbi:hypothetical protein RUM44_009708 [Polyplax serrata]|uniref:RING-type domain-containing protein n=1 Tax=Polyplax serrata TaxID=468196 RepID=A0ABR1AU23_POLSC
MPKSYASMANRGDGPSKKVDYKARLEKKLYLARENPEPIFDISDCNLKQLPNNIFSLCRVFRKDTLYLQNNLLTSLKKGGSLEELSNLKILNLSSNNFSELTSSISYLTCLEMLDISCNKLKELPKEIGELKNLVWLNASHNNLQNLPNTIGDCQNLESLNITYNSSLIRLPVTLGKLKYIGQIEIDPTVQYPPKEVYENGLFQMMNFLRRELKEQLDNLSWCKITARDNVNLTQLQELKNVELMCDTKFSDSKSHDQKQEKNSGSMEAKLKLQENIKNEQKAMQEKLASIQEQKKNERKLLIKLCQTEEKSSCEAVSRILDNNKKVRTSMFDLWGKERKDEEEKLMNLVLMNNKDKPTSRQKIIESMDETMRDELEKYEKINNRKRLGTLNKVAAETALSNSTLNELLKKANEDKKQLVDMILLDENLQKSAVVSLFEKTDATSWELAKQISIIENKLAELTRLELTRKKIATDCQLVELNENRTALTKMLVSLFNEQTQRRNALLDEVNRMGTIRDTNHNSSNFWLDMYNAIFNSKSNEMVRYLEALDQNLVYHLFTNGVFHYLPLLKDVALNEDKLVDLNVNVLTKLGIKNAEDRKNVLYAVKTFLNSKSSKRALPSAPEFVEPSAPLMGSSNEEVSLNYLVPEECIICFDLKPTIIFLPCGHVCCCCKCFKGITTCPMCRTDVERVHDADFTG